MVGRSSKCLPFLQKFEAKRRNNPSFRIMCSNKLLAVTVILIACSNNLFSGLEVSGEYIPPGPKFKCPTPTQIWPCQCLSTRDEGLTLHCNDVSLATLSAALAFPIAFKIPVEYLYLTKLNTEKLYGNIFENLNATKIRIEDSPLREIFSDAFFPLRDTLTELELIKTNLEEFPIQAFQDMVKLETLTIDQHRISSLKNAITGFDSLKNLRISNGNISEFAKDTFAGLGGKLVRLDLHGNRLKTVPKDGFQNLKNLEYFDVAHNNFDKLDPSYFVHLTKLTWFNGSHNAIPEFKRGAFARNSFLRVIYLTHNKITKIDAAAFRGMRLLVRLYLSDNQITDVGRAAFNSLQRIKTIDLARNQLQFVDFQMFMKLPFCEEIFLQENQLTRVKTGAFNELAYVVVNVSHNQISVFEKESFVNCVNITILDMSHNRIDNFTKGAFDEISYPNEWKLEFNLLKRTSDIPLKFMTGIKLLNISYNSLEEVSKNTFPKLYELHSVDLSNNNLSKIHSGIFGNLFSLRYLDLRNNSMTDLGGSSLGSLPTLLELHLDHNKLKTVSNAAFARLVSLRELTISHNKLKKVFQISGSLNDLNASYNEIDSLAKAWPVMNALQRLDLSGNNLGGNLGRGSFENLNALSEIRLSSNNFNDIPVDALSELRTVQYIDLASNFISKLPKAAFGRLPIVFTLLLSNNSISAIEYKAFEGLIQLLHLDLSNNNLTSIPIGGFAGLVSLRKLLLNNNMIERTDNGTHCLFEDNLSLETLNLSNNEIGGINPRTFPELQWTNYKLSNVDLSNNRIVILTKDLLRGTKTLRELNLSNNKISEIKPKVLGNMTSLERLDLSGNEIKSIDVSIIGPPRNLTVLKLANNTLRKFPSDILPKAPLKLIDLRGNRIKYFDTDFVAKIRNGSRLLLNGNPIDCDCRLIFLQRYYTGLRPELTNFTSQYFRDYDNFQCKFDSRGSPELLKNLTEEQLACDYHKDLTAPQNIPENHDVEIRSFTQVGQSLELRWRVKSKMDILGFKVLVLGDNWNILSSKSFGYFVRAAGVLLDKGARSFCLVPNFSTSSLGDSIRNGDVQGMKKICQKLDGAEVLASYANGGVSKYAVGMKLPFLVVAVNWFNGRLTGY